MYNLLIDTHVSGKKEAVTCLAGKEETKRQELEEISLLQAVQKLAPCWGSHSVALVGLAEDILTRLALTKGFQTGHVEISSSTMPKKQLLIAFIAISYP